MIGIDPSAPEAGRRWAADYLGVAPEASADEALTAFLRSLPEYDFVPSDLSVAAADAFAGDPLQAQWAAAEAGAARLLEDVDSFTHDYWSLTPTLRRERWQNLTGLCTALPTLTAWLKHLRAGLDVEPPPHQTDETVAALIQEVLAQFLLRPTEQARARQAFLRQHQEEISKWGNAAKTLAVKSPSLAKLTPELLKTLARGKKDQAVLKQAWHPKSEDSVTGSPSRRLLGIGLAVLFILMRFLMMGSKSPPPPPSPEFQQKSLERFQQHLSPKKPLVPEPIPVRPGAPPAD